jgi:hypothetical protein
MWVSKQGTQQHMQIKIWVCEPAASSHTTLEFTVGMKNITIQFLVWKKSTEKKLNPI